MVPEGDRPRHRNQGASGGRESEAAGLPAPRCVPSTDRKVCVMKSDTRNPRGVSGAKPTRGGPLVGRKSGPGGTGGGAGGGEGAAQMPPPSSQPPERVCARVSGGGEGICPESRGGGTPLS